MIRLVIDDPALAEKVSEGGDPLKTLCREEADKFEKVMQTQDPGFGKLAQFERMAIQSYLYQKVRGRIDQAEAGDDVEERADGEA